MAEHLLNRRQTLAGVAVVGVSTPLLAACGDEEPAGTATDPDTPASSAASSSAPAEGTSAPAADGLASASEIPVGGGKVFPDENVVIVQPSDGEFKGWSATCTHQGCAVTEVSDGLINCPCHGSRFSIEDGSPDGGPASQPLSEVPLSVQGDTISLA